MTTEDSVSELLQQLAGGDSLAAQQLWERYLQDMVRLARAKLGAAPRRAADEEDVVLSAFDAFLQGGKVYLAELFGCDPDTITAGERDVAHLPNDPAAGRVRKRGAD